MKKLFVMAAMVLSSVGAFAQQAAGTTTLQPKVGLNVATIGDNDWKAGFAAGAELQYQAADNFGIAVGALYSVQGFKGKDVDIDTPIGSGTIKNDFKWNPGYINVPITLNYYPVAGLALKAGLQPGFLVNKDDMDDAKTVDLSIPVGLSYEYQGIVFDARYNIGVTKIADNVDHYNNVIQITVGFTSSLSNQDFLTRQNNNPRSSLRRAGISFFSSYLFEISLT